MNIHNLNHRIYNSRKQLTNLKLERSNWWDDKDMVAYYDEKISDLLEVISNLSKQKEELLSLKGKTFTNKLFKTITKNLEDMQTIATINEVFAKRKRDEQRILNGAKTLKVFEVNSEVQTIEGVEKVQTLVKEVCPKRAIAVVNEEFLHQDIKVWKVVNIVAPNKKKGYVTYEVANNKHILR